MIDGTLSFAKDIKAWPKDDKGRVLECFYLENLTNVTFTSSGDKGTFDGNGEVWWGLPGIGYLINGGNRPRLFHIINPKEVLVEKIFFKNSPMHTFHAD